MKKKTSLLKSALLALTAATLPSISHARELGIDVSSYQGSGVNWTSVNNSSRSFGWAKATEGVSTTDADFTVNVNHAKSAGVIVGGYHFAHPESNSPGSEASHFWGVAGGYIKPDNHSLSSMLDMEVFSGHVGASSYSAWANSWCSTIKNNCANNNIAMTPAIYVSACNACNFGSSSATWLSDIADYNGESSSTGTPWSTCSSCNFWGGGSWNWWQYSSTGSVPGVSGNCDVDVFNGTIKQLYATGVAKVLGTGLRTDFNGDGRDDYALFRPSDATWHVTFSSDTTKTYTFQFGATGDIPLLCGDFNGDGKADAVVFRPSTGTWYVRWSTDASFHSFQYGQNGDIPLLGGDFDGDGVPDAVVFRPSTSTWYVRYSSNGASHSFQYGTTGDIPLMNGDFNGDGNPDAVVFRPSDGTFHVRWSTDASSHAFQFGQNGDVPLLGGDYDNDGIPDVTVFRPSTGTWYVRYSSDGGTRGAFQWGVSGDTPFASYITSDHSIDQNIYRPSTGKYYIRNGSTGATSSIVLGAAGDIPVY